MTNHDMFRLQMVSGLVKARLTDNFDRFEPLRKVSVLRADRLYFSALFVNEDAGRKNVNIRVNTSEGMNVKTYMVEQVPVRLPHYNKDFDSDYIGHTPGLYPDLLRPMEAQERTVPGRLYQMYFEWDVPADFAPGKYTVSVEIIDAGVNECVCCESLDVTVFEAVLPPQKTVYSQWFYCDCIADYYGVEIFSERHWQLIENFAKTAVHTGINTLLTPVFTPALDTKIGGERPTVQLVDVTVKDGKYAFGWKKLQRFCELCRRVGIENLEIAHFFTQWGAEHAPKVMATVDGVYRRIFGWETAATSEEYIGFLRTLIPKLKKKLDEFGYKDHYFFHISDEPHEDHLENYKAAKNAILDLINDHPVRDALSRYAFYEQGVVTQPICSVKHADEFVEKNVPDLYVYYCCGPGNTQVNRFIAMPGHRARAIGIQMFKTGATGFLHWGYNFYYSQLSVRKINPYLINDSDYAFPAGDPFSVYPLDDGTAAETLRTAQFYQALTDIRAMELAAEKVGREAVIAEIDRCGSVSYSYYPRDPQFYLDLRERINRMAAGLPAEDEEL